MKKLDEHQLKLLALVTFVVILGGWMLTKVGIVASGSPLDWALSLSGGALALTYLVCTIISRRSS